ncbi:hypothetical protein BC833DRAFT_581356 [Globomyces pollinis-pini]|nr:hypothetical protein BC833DRAFT_581356 [Globomyces pollinis-pini]
MYIKCEINGLPAYLEDYELKNIINLAVKQQYGQWGASFPIDLLHWVDKIIYLRTDYQSSSILLSSLPTITYGKGNKLQVRVLNQSPSLPSIID